MDIHLLAGTRLFQGIREHEIEAMLTCLSAEERTYRKDAYIYRAGDVTGRLGKADNRLDADGTLRGTFTVTAEGQSDSNIRRIFTTGFQSEWKNTMERQLLAVSPKARLLSVDYGRNPKDYQSAPIKITFRYEIPDYALKGKDMLCFHPMVMNNLYNQVRSYLRIDTGVKERKYGFKDACSRLVESCRI